MVRGFVSTIYYMTVQVKICDLYLAYKFLWAENNPISVGKDRVEWDILFVKSFSSIKIIAIEVLDLDPFYFCSKKGVHFYVYTGGLVRCEEKVPRPLIARFAEQVLSTYYQADLSSSLNNNIAVGYLRRKSFLTLFGNKVDDRRVEKP